MRTFTAKHKRNKIKIQKQCGSLHKFWNYIREKGHRSEEFVIYNYDPDKVSNKP